MTWVNLQDGTPADAAEVDSNFKHIRQGDVLPFTTGFIPTTGAFDLGSDSYKFDKVYVSDIAGTCTIATDVKFSGEMTFGLGVSPVFERIASPPSMMICRYYVTVTVAPAVIGTSYTATTINTTTFNNITGATLSSNQITLPTGDYYTEFVVSTIAQSGGNAGARAVLWDVVNSLSVAISGHGQTFAQCMLGYFSILTATVFELRALQFGSGTEIGYISIHPQVRSDIRFFKVG